jgi:hypothetical protein
MFRGNIPTKPPYGDAGSAVRAAHAGGTFTSKGHDCCRRRVNSTCWQPACHAPLPVESVLETTGQTAATASGSRALLIKLGAAQDRTGHIATGLVTVEVAKDGALTYQLDRVHMRTIRGCEGRYPLRTNPAQAIPSGSGAAIEQPVFVTSRNRSACSKANSTTPHCGSRTKSR